jgi:hypothetical protein
MKSGRACPCGLTVSFGSRSMPSGVRNPKSRGIEGPVISASRMPTRLPARRNPTAKSPVVSDFPTPPLPDITATTALKVPRLRNAPGGPTCGTLSSFMIVGTRPECRACVSAATIGSTRKPCAFAPASRVSYLLTPHPEQCSPKAVRTSSAIGRSATSSRILVPGLIVNVAMRRRLQPLAGNTSIRPSTPFTPAQHQHTRRD